MEDLGKLIIIFGVLIVIIGSAIFLLGKEPFLGKLPGDISIQQGNFSCFFPLATSIMLSLLLTIVLNIILRLLNK